MAANAAQVQVALESLPSDLRDRSRLVFTAHSIPTAMNDLSGPDADGRYAAQQRETARLVAEAVRGSGAEFDLVWQSRSGPPQVPWLEPDINDHLKQLAAAGAAAVVVAPTGFVSDHIEVRWDLDHEARGTAAAVGLPYARAATVGTHPAFVAAIRELVEEAALRSHAARARPTGPDRNGLSGRLLSGAATGRPGRVMTFPDGPEIELPAGDVTVGVVRIGDTVRRPHQDTSARVADYLRHLEQRGFEGAPRYLGRDDQGRDVLTYLDGEVPGDPIERWAAADGVLRSVAGLVRRLHDASAGYVIPERTVEPGRPQPRFPADEPRIVSQRDVTPQNTVFRAGVAWGLIDFDLSDWTTRSVDLANTAMHWVPLCDPADRGPAFADVDVAARLRLLLDGYGREVIEPEQFLHAAELRFAGSYDVMHWAAENLGGGWARMWDEGVGDVIRRRVAWFAAVREDLARAL